MMQNVGIHFWNYYTKSWNSTQNNAIKQMHCKFKLENTQKNDLKNLYPQKNTIWMFFGLFSSTTNSWNLLSISPHTPMTTKVVVVITNNWSMWLEKLWMVSFDKKCNFTRRSNAEMVVTFVVVESSIIFFLLWGGWGEERGIFFFSFDDFLF